MKKLGLLALISLSLALSVGLSIHNPALQQFNLALSVWLQSVQPKWLITLNQVISGVELLIAPSFILLSLVGFIKGRRHDSLFIFLAGASWAIGRLLKLAFAEACPSPPDVYDLYYFSSVGNGLSQTIPGLFHYAVSKLCFPSGHAFTYTVFGGWLYIMRNRIFPPGLARLLAPILLLLIALVAQSRISLGSHWTFDVVAGYLFGFAWLVVLLFFYHTTLIKR